MKSAPFQPPPGQEVKHLSAPQKLPLTCLLEVTKVLIFYDQKTIAIIKQKKMLRNERPGLKCARKRMET